MAQKNLYFPDEFLPAFERRVESHGHNASSALRAAFLAFSEMSFEERASWFSRAVEWEKQGFPLAGDSQEDTLGLSAHRAAVRAARARAASRRKRGGSKE